MTKPESCRIVYKEASGFQPEPEEEREHKQDNHTVATPTTPQNPECRASNKSSELARETVLLLVFILLDFVDGLNQLVWNLNV